MILPFAAEVKIKPKIGHADSAPTKPHLGIKFIVTSLISVIITALVMHIINQGIFVRFIEKYLSFLSNI